LVVIDLYLIPLGRSLDEKRAQVVVEEEEEEEKEAPHLFLAIKVITDESFSHHQGFDLAVFDKENPTLSDPPAFHVPEQTTYRAFKSIVAKHFNYHESRIRFRVLVNRKNKTVRPDARIPENELSLCMPREFCADCF